MSDQDFPQKDQFRNDAGHVVGAVILDPQNQPKGVPVHPGETIFLSETEQKLTAHAPRKAEDNPLANGKLVPSNEPRPTRVIAQQASETAPRPTAPPAAPEPTTEATQEGVRTHSNPNLPQGGPPPLVPQGPPPEDVTAAERAKALGIQPGALSGTDDTPAQQEEETAVEQPEQPAGDAPEGQRDEREETGAAVPPQGPPPEGEFQAEEEVGTPDAPAAPAPPPRMGD